jgi:hypothetical protein
MNAPRPTQKNSRQNRLAAAVHRFSVGQTVRLKGFGATKVAEIYRITLTLPPVGNALQYRIRNDDERHERVASEDSLELAAPAFSGTAETLIERTFGHG